MSNTIKVLLTALAILLFSGISHAGNTAGVFRLPFDPNQRWSDCSQTGFTDINPNGLVFMERNTNLNPPKYHLAEDWNGKCSGSTDLGAVLYAIADGVVENADMGGSPKSQDGGGWLLIKHQLPDTTSRYILYEHLLDIAINPRTGAKLLIQKTG